MTKMLSQADLEETVARLGEPGLKEATCIERQRLHVHAIPTLTGSIHISASSYSAYTRSNVCWPRHALSLHSMYM